MRSVEAIAVINRALQKARDNAHGWRKSEPEISSQLREGVSSVAVACVDLEHFNMRGDPRERCHALLQAMLAKLEPLWSHYRSLPGNEGEWECSALGIIEDEIKILLQTGYVPTEAELEKARWDLNRR